MKTSNLRNDNNYLDLILHTYLDAGALVKHLLPHRREHGDNLIEPVTAKACGVRTLMNLSEIH